MPTGFCLDFIGKRNILPPPDSESRSSCSKASNKVVKYLKLVTTKITVMLSVSIS